MPNQKELQYASKLITLYTKLYKDKYDKTILINRVKMKWLVGDVIESMGGYGETVAILNYYFNTGKDGHPLDWFCYNFDRLVKMEQEIKDDLEHQAKVRAETKKRREEWEARNELRRAGN